MKRMLRPLLDRVSMFGPTNLLHNARPMRASELSLTPRQRNVLELLWCGMSDKDIAKSLGMPEHTVRVHVSLLLPKLKLRRRTDASALAICWNG